MPITIPVEQIRKGDKFTHDGRLYWTAQADAVASERTTHMGVVVVVQFVDGGIEPRYWQEGDEIIVERP